MRLWHKDLIPVLPMQQLLGQWRECCLIAKNIAEKGTPNHLLVNKMMNYPIDHFIAYSRLIMREMSLRGYKVNGDAFDKYGLKPVLHHQLMHYELFAGWHDYCYLRQCYYNLQEKRDCGGITDEEWYNIHHVYITQMCIAKYD